MQRQLRLCCFLILEHLENVILRALSQGSLVLSRCLREMIFFFDMPQKISSFFFFPLPLSLLFRSILTYSRIGGHVKTLTFCQGSHYLAIASDNGAIQLLGIEASKLPKSPKIHPIQSRYVLRTVKSHRRAQAVSIALG